MFGGNRGVHVHRGDVVPDLGKFVIHENYSNIKPGSSVDVNDPLEMLTKLWGLTFECMLN